MAVRQRPATHYPTTKLIDADPTALAMHMNTIIQARVTPTSVTQWNWPLRASFKYPRLGFRVWG